VRIGNTKIDEVVYFQQFTLGRPANQLLFLSFQSLILFDKIEFKLDGYFANNNKFWRSG